MHAYVSSCYPAGWVPAVAVAEAQAPVPGDPRGEAMVAELKWVHDMIRRDLRTVRQMAADAAAGRGQGMGRQLRSELKMLTALPVAELRAQADDLARQLRELDVRIQQSNWQFDLME